MPARFTFGGSVSATVLNQICEAADYVAENTDTLTRAQSGMPANTYGMVLLRIDGNTASGSNRYVYTGDAVLPTATAYTEATRNGTHFNNVTAYNLAEWKNTAGAAGGGVNATRANTLGFAMLPVPTNSIVLAFPIRTTGGKTVLVFDRQNIFDGECTSSLVTTIDGGAY
jgi:hypothetical protein